MNEIQCPAELSNRPQWVIWRYEMRGELSNAKQTKVPYMATETGRMAKSNDPSTWATFEQAAGAVTLGHGDGIGYVFSSDDPYVGVDLDKVLDENGVLLNEARIIVDELNSYTEISPSNRGLHIFVKGKLPPGQRRKGFIEMYDSERYFTFTGKIFESARMIEDRQTELEALHKRIFPLQAPVETIPVGTDFITGESLDLTTDDNTLIEEIRKSKQGAKFEKLYGRGDISDYPSQSEADSALCMILAFWTKKNPDQMNRLFQSSKLMRDKWNEVHYSNGLTYGQNTVAQAMGLVSEVRKDKVKVDIGGFYEPSEQNNEETIGANYEWQTNNLFEVSDLEIAQIPDTHLANSFRLAKFHGHELCYVGGEGWLWFNGAYWERNEDKALVLAGRVGRYVIAEARELYKMALAAPSEDEQKRIRAEADKLMKWARTSEMKETMAATIKIAKATMRITLAQVDSDPYKLCVANGTLDLREHSFRPHNPKDLITRMSPTMFVSGVTAPKFERFINTIFEGNTELVSYIQRIFGYCLTGVTGERAFFFFHGQGSNGKTKLVEVLVGILGDMLATQTVSEFMQTSNGDRHSTEIAELRGYRVAVTSESEVGRKFASKRLKQLTGDDDIKARKLYQENMLFKITFKLFLTANHKPPTDDLTNSFWQRLKIIPFNVTFTPDGANGTVKWNKRIVEELLREESSGILNWMLEGLKEWQRIGLSDPKIVQELGKQYRGEVDNVAKFVDEVCIREAGAREQPRTLWDAYEMWFSNNQQNLELSEKVKIRDFYGRLQDLGYPKTETHGVVYFRNIMLKGEKMA